MEDKIEELNETIRNLHLYIDMIQSVAEDLYHSSEDLIGLHAGHPNHPELDSGEARKERKQRVIPKACQATERYMRLVLCENVGCLDENETQKDREELMDALVTLRKCVIQSKMQLSL